MARGREANKRRWRGGRALYAARGGSEVLWGGESSGRELAGVGKQRAAAAARRGGGKGGHQEVKWDQEELGRLCGTPNGGAGNRWVRETAAASGGAIPAKREEEEDEKRIILQK